MRRREGCRQVWQAPALQGQQLPPRHHPVHVPGTFASLIQQLCPSPQPSLVFHDLCVLCTLLVLNNHCVTAFGETKSQGLVVKGQIALVLHC